MRQRLSRHDVCGEQVAGPIGTLTVARFDLGEVTSKVTHTGLVTMMPPT
jgi:hypothetical protein